MKCPKCGGEVFYSILTVQPGIEQIKCWDCDYCIRRQNMFKEEKIAPMPGTDGWVDATLDFTPEEI